MYAKQQNNKTTKQQNNMKHTTEPKKIATATKKRTKIIQENKSIFANLPDYLIQNIINWAGVNLHALRRVSVRMGSSPTVWVDTTNLRRWANLHVVVLSHLVIREKEGLFNPDILVASPKGKQKFIIRRVHVLPDGYVPALLVHWVFGTVD